MKEKNKYQKIYQTIPEIAVRRTREAQPCKSKAVETPDKDTRGWLAAETPDKDARGWVMIGTRGWLGASIRRWLVAETPDKGTRGWNMVNTRDWVAAETPDKDTRGWNVYGTRRWNNAFTLIELLVVVLIIGILSAIALPQYTTAVEKSRAAEALMNIKHFQQAMQLQYLTDPKNQNFVIKDVVEFSGGTWNEDGGSYCTKNFYYNIDPGRIRAERCTSFADQCDGCNSSDYALRAYTPFGGSTWQTDGSFEAGSSTGEKLASFFASQGFNS